MKKKFLFLLFFSLLMAVALCGCVDKGGENKYFRNYSSQGAFERAVPGITLPEGVSVYSFDAENEVFIICRSALSAIDNSTVTLFGLCGYDKVYVQPVYAGIEAIRGDVAIVYKTQSYEDSAVNTIGVIKFRGGNEGELTEFSPVDSTVTLFQFVGDYIVTLGLKSYASGDFNFSTFYDYSQGVLLEAFRLRCGADYSFLSYDDYVVAIGKDHAFFYEKKSNVNGYLVPYRPTDGDSDSLAKYGYYVPYPEDTEGEYADYIKIDIFYLGNGWFSRTAQLRDEEIFEGYQICYQEVDTSTLNVETKTYYANVRCDFYNARTHETRSNDWLIVRAVANKYNADYYGQMESYLNNLSTYNDELGAYEYHLPYLDPSGSVKDGYSIVYYYYLPYVEQENYLAETSFCIVSDRLEVDRLADAQILLPPVYVDGYGVPTGDPVYEPYFGSVYVYDKGLTGTELLPYVEGRKTYQSFFYYDNGVVCQEINYDESSGKYGIVSKDGRVIVDFSYDLLSPYFGEYAVGVKNNRYYRIDRLGQTTLLNDVVNVRQGVYVYADNTKLGLRNYAGEEILPASFDKLEVVETVMKEGVFLESYAVVTANNATTIYRLE